MCALYVEHEQARLYVVGMYPIYVYLRDTVSLKSEIKQVCVCMFFSTQRTREHFCQCSVKRKHIARASGNARVMTRKTYSITHRVVSMFMYVHS